MISRTLASFAIIAFCLSLAVVLALPLASPAQADTPTSGSITGIASDSVMSFPIAMATISVNGTSLSAITAQDGSYTISNVPAGSYTVTASAASYNSSQQAVTVTAGQTSTLNFTMTPTPTVNNYVLSVSTDKLTYAPGDTITFSGSLKSSSGDPVPGKQIAVDDPVAMQCVSGPTTDASGNFNYQSYTNSGSKGVYGFAFHAENTSIFAAVAVKPIYSLEQEDPQHTIPLGFGTSVLDFDIALTVKMITTNGFPSATQEQLAESLDGVTPLMATYIKNVAVDFVSNPANDAVVLADIGCLAGFWTGVFTIPCAALYGYTIAAGAKALIMGGIDTYIDTSSNLSAAEKLHWKAVAKTADCLYGIVTLDPKYAVTTFSSGFTCGSAFAYVTNDTLSLILTPSASSQSQTSTGLVLFKKTTPAVSPTPVYGTFTLSGGSGQGTYNTLPPYQLLSGIMSVSGSINGDLSGGTTLDATYSTVDELWHGSSQLHSGTLTVEGNNHPATYYVKGAPQNVQIGTPGPGGAPVTFDMAGYLEIWTTDGSDIFVYATMSGSGSAMESWPLPGLWTMTNMSASGSWTGSVLTLAGAPQVCDVTPGGGTVTLTGLEGIVAQLDYSTTSSGTVVMAQYNANPQGTPPKPTLDKYVEVDATMATTQINWPVQLRIYYSQAEVDAAGIDEITLRMYRWNGSSWTVVADSGVNPLDNYVWANLTSFSPYAPMGDPTNTPVGDNVTVDVSSAIVTFTSVTGEGATGDTLEAAPCGSLPSGFISSGSTHHITTTATYTGLVTVGIRYNDSGIPNEADLRLFHCDGTGWTDVTTSLDTVNNIIYGQDSTLSWWLVGGPSGGGGGGGGGVPVFPNIYIGIGAALGAGVLAFFMRRRLVRQL